MKRVVLYAVLLVASSAICGELDVARQALADGVWRSAIVAADNAAAATNISIRSEARLISLEALANLEDDAEIRRRLSLWKEESSDHFRFWRIRSLIRVRDFEQAKEAMEKPFTDGELLLPAATLKASMLMASGKYREALQAMSGVDIDKQVGLAGDDARLIVAEALYHTGEREKSQEMLSSLAGSSGRREIKIRSGFLLGFSEMDDISSYTTGVKRVRALLRLNPEDRESRFAARSFADRLLKAGDAAGAEDEYRRYCEIFPSAAMDAEILERRGESLFYLKRYSEATGFFARAEQLAEKQDDKSRLAYLQANAYMAEKKFLDAAVAFGRSVSYGGKDRNRSLYLQADALERAGEIARASEIYKETSGVDDEWGRKANLRNVAIVARNGRLGEAIDLYTKILEASKDLSDEDVTEAYLGRGRACYRDYRFKEASADFEKVASRKPELADGMRFLMALCLYGAGRDQEAKQAAVELMNSTKDEELRADLLLWCAKYEFNNGEYKIAQSRFAEYATLKKGKQSSADALLWAARSASAQMEYSKAVDLATQAANSSANDKQLFVESLLVQGEAVMELGRYAEAVQLFERVSGLAGEDSIVQKSLMLKADALYAMGAGDTGRYEESIKAYRKLLDVGGLSPDRKIETAFKIARALEKLRRTKESMDQYYRNVVLAYSQEVSSGVLFGTPARTFFSRAAFSLSDYHAAAGDVSTARKMLKRIIAAEVPAAKEARRRLDELNAKGIME